MGPSRHLSTTPSDGFWPSSLLQTTLSRVWGFPGIFQQPLPMALALPGFKAVSSGGFFRKKSLGPEIMQNATKTDHLKHLGSLGPGMVQNGTQTGHAAIFQQLLPKVLGLSSLFKQPLPRIWLFQASFSNPFQAFWSFRFL